MSKYLEFQQIPFKGKTKRFEVISKRSIGVCPECNGLGFKAEEKNHAIFTCPTCKGTGKTDIILGRISWYRAWRQYTFSPAFETIWNRECLKDVQDFLQQLMDERK